MTEIEALQMKKSEIETELKQLENRQKILLNRKHKEERRQRTHTPLYSAPVSCLI